MNWQLIDNNEMERIHVRKMHRDFPPGELKGVDVMERLRADGCYWPYACYDEAGRLLAYAFLCGLPGEPNVLLDYYAVLPAVRCRGLGAELLARLRGVCAGRWQGILIEAEDPAEAPDEGLAIRRLGFYTRAGARMLKWESRVFGVHYRLFCLPCAEKDAPAAEDDALVGSLARLYHEMVPGPLYGPNVAFWQADAQRPAFG